MMKRPLSAGWKDQVLIASKNTRFDPARIWKISETTKNG